MCKTIYRLRAAAFLTLMACALNGCGTLNGWMAAGFEDYMPAWAGGLPADAPPRPGTLKYDEFQKERERQRQEPAEPKAAATGSIAGTPTSAMH